MICSKLAKFIKLMLRNIQCYLTTGATATYHRLLFKLYWGAKISGFRKQRTENCTYSIFAPRLEFDISNNTLPLLQSRKIFVKGIIAELCWMLKGDTNIKYLNDLGVHIWDQWADENGDLGPVYGKQFTDFGGVNQIERLINNLLFDPYSRRHLVSLWNVGELDQMALPPCHYSFQVLVKGKDLTLILNMRSMDVPCGTPFNIVFYAALAHRLAQESLLNAVKLVVNGGDAHIYENQILAVEELLLRSPVEPKEKPQLTINPTKPVSDFYGYIVTGYNPLPAIKFPKVDA